MSKFYEALSEMVHDPLIIQMKQFAQHNSSTTFNHSLHVALTAYRLSKILGWEIDERSLARGAMLHDFYLYNARSGQVSPWKHGFGHSKTALHNSMKHFKLTDIETEIILCHMWPLNITKVPRSKESILVMLADKYCATKELMAQKKIAPAM